MRNIHLISRHMMELSLVQDTNGTGHLPFLLVLFVRLPCNLSCFSTVRMDDFFFPSYHFCFLSFPCWLPPPRRSRPLLKSSTPIRRVRRWPESKILGGLGRERPGAALERDQLPGVLHTRSPFLGPVYLASGLDPELKAPVEGSASPYPDSLLP